MLPLEMEKPYNWLFLFFQRASAPFNHRWELSQDLIPRMGPRITRRRILGLEGADYSPKLSLLLMLKSYAALGRAWAIAQEKPAISLAIAVFATFDFFPLAIKY